jgi:VCBS repeat-containing protein
LLANDIDPDLITNPNETLTIVMPTASFSLSGASVTFDPITGEITYDPTVSGTLQALAPGQTLVDSFAYSLRDAAGLQSNVTTVALTVTGINDAPRVQFDSPQLNPSGPTVIRVLDNDVDVDGFIVASTLRIELPPAFGSAEIQLDGTILYTSFGGSSQEDVFTYTVADNLGLRSRTALVTLSSNASPIAVNDARTTFLDEAIVIEVAANDSDPDGSLNLASIQIVTSPLRGQAIPQANGTVQYVPNPGFLGRDSFQYQISDNLGRPSNVATVAVEVLASRLQNPDTRFDVNDDGAVTSLDALLIINHLARSDGAVSIPVLPSDRGPNYYDVNGNKQITSADALAVINELARINNGSGVGFEQVVSLAPVPTTSASPLAVSRLHDAQIGSEETLTGAAKIVNVAFSALPIQEELVDLIAASKDESDEEAYRDALDAAFAALL